MVECLLRNRSVAHGQWRLDAVVASLRMMAVGVGLTLCAVGQQQAVDHCPALEEARRLVAHEQWGNATQTLRQNIGERPACADAHYLLAYTYLRANDPRASLAEYTLAAKLRPPGSDDFTAVASDYILLKAYTDAEHWLVRATQTPPVNAQAWYLLGRTQYNLDHNADAVVSFQHSLAALPEDPRSEYNLGLAYERLQQPELARAAYQTAIQWGERTSLHDAQPYLDLGTLDRSQGHPEEALPFLQRAAEISPGNPLIFQELGRTLSEMHRLEEAIVAFKTAITLAPSAEAPHFFLGRVYRACGKVTEASEQFAIVQRLAKNQSSTATPNTDHRPF